MPGFWCYVGEEYYQEAKDVIFGENNKEYEKLIEKIDNFHYNILNKSKEIVKKSVDNGLDNYILVKYGLSMTPFTDETYQMQSDFLVGTSNSSLGATCTNLMEKFNNSYIENAKQNGTYKYIGPDLQIDASTCLLKDKTWFIKNIAHKNMADCVSPLISTIIYHDGPMTVFDDESFPQYMVVDDKSDNMYPQTKENCDTQKKNKMTFFESVIGIFKSIFKLIANIGK